MAVNWIWIAYLMLEICHSIFAIIFVVILRLDTPESWPPLFGSPLEAWTIRRFWGKFWHKLSARSTITIGNGIASQLLCLPYRERQPKLYNAVMAS
jgi:hypothetical protein